MLDKFSMIRLAFLYNESIDLPKLSEQKNIAGRVPEAPRRDKASQETVIETEVIACFIKPLTHYLPKSDLKIGETLTTVTKRSKMQQNERIAVNLIKKLKSFHFQETEKFNKTKINVGAMTLLE